MPRKPFSSKVRLSDDYFDQLERTGVRLNPEHRRKIEEALQRYERQCGARLAESEVRRMAGEKNQLLGFARCLEKAIRLANTMQKEHPQAWKRLADAGTRHSTNIATCLQELKDSAEKSGRRRQRHKLPRYFFLPGLLTTLERIFKDAGGGKTGISRGGEKKRQGRFLKFLDTALSPLPRSIRPATKDALGKQWEDIFSAREKRGNQISISHPFLTFTSRWLSKGSKNRRHSR
jgi:hypothetical protein